MYEKILKWYRQGLWTEIMVENAVSKGVLAEEQKIAILGTEEE